MHRQQKKLLNRITQLELKNVTQCGGLKFCLEYGTLFISWFVATNLLPIDTRSTQNNLIIINNFFLKNSGYVTQRIYCEVETGFHTNY